MIPSLKDHKEVTVKKPVLIKSIQLPSNLLNSGAVINLQGIAEEGTVLSKDFQENGGEIDLTPYQLYDNWKRTIRGITVPPVPVTYEMQNTRIAVLHPIAVRANQVARNLEALKKNEIKFTTLQKSVNAFYHEICNTIFGKSGVFNRWILGPRLKKSFRAVVVPMIYDKDIFGESYEWVGIPERICHKLKIKDGDIVVIGRDPTIWYGSVELLYAYSIPNNVIGLHPLLLPQFGGDHDGDQLWGYFPKQDLVPPGEVASFTRKYATWQKNFNDQRSSSAVDWNNFTQDQCSRQRTTGLSVGPTDISARETEEKGSILRIQSYSQLGKRNRGKLDGLNELQQYARGLRLEDWKSHTVSINTAQLAMKVYMGPVGLLALRLICIGHMDPKISESSNILAERCAQGLLDAKHLSYEEAKNFKPANIFKILNLGTKCRTAKEMLAELQKIVPCDERILPILDYILRDGRGVQNMSRESFPLFEGITSTASMDPNGYMPQSILEGVETIDEGIVSYAFNSGLT